MITIGTILTIVALVLVLWILFKIFTLVIAALNIPAPWGRIAYWVVVLLVVIWALRALGITQPIIK